MASVIQLPVFTDVPNWTEQVTLDGRVYTIRFHWNGREGYWYAHILDELGLDYIDGTRVTKVIPLLGDADSDSLLRQMARDDVKRGDRPGTSIRTLCLFPEALPGLLWVFGGASLRGEMADLSRVEIIYADEDQLAQLYAGLAALESAA